MSDTQIIVAKDKDLSGRKKFAIFNSHQQLLDYIYRVPAEERMLYEWILPNQPTKLVFDIDSEDTDVINNPATQHLMYQNVYLKTVEVLQDLNIDCRRLRFAISDSTRPKKFSVHMVANFYFKSWKLQCDFIKKVYSELISAKGIDGSIYHTTGGRAMRTILSTKFGKKSFLMPIENDQARFDRYQEWSVSQNVPLDSAFLMPEITEEKHHLDHLLTYVDPDEHFEIDVPAKYLKNVDKVETMKAEGSAVYKAMMPPKEAGSDVVLEGLAKVIADNAIKFKDYVDDYGLWISIGIKMVIADLPYECFRLISIQSIKFNEEQCVDKWNNLQSCYGHQSKDINQLKKFLKYIGLNVSIDFSYKTSASNLDFDYDMFNKEIMIDYSLKIPEIKPEYHKYTMDTLNRFFGIVTLTKLEIFQVRYDDKQHY